MVRYECVKISEICHADLKDSAKHWQPFILLVIIIKALDCFFAKQMLVKLHYCV